MKNIMFGAVIFISFGALAAGGPTSIGTISIGMTKKEYISTLGVSLFDCNKIKGNSKGFVRFAPEALNSELKLLCIDIRPKRTTGTIESIQVGGLSYEVVTASFQASKFVRSLGSVSTAFFVNDRLISVQIDSPQVSLETLTAKYGPPKQLDNTKVEICQNNIGNEFKNRVGKIEAIWNNGEVKAILQRKLGPPIDTCSDGGDSTTYIIEDRKQLEPIETAINNFRKVVDKKKVKNSPF